MSIEKSRMFLGFLLVVVIAGGVLGYSHLSRESAGARKILDIEMPMEQAMREVEVSIWETANAIYYYLVYPSVTSLEEYKSQLKDVEKFKTIYKHLIDTDEETKMVAKFENMWADSVSKAGELVELRDRMTELVDETWDTVHTADDIIGYKIQASFVKGVPELLEKEKNISEVNESIWEVFSAHGYYLYKHSEKAKKEFTEQLVNVDEYWGNYKKLTLTAVEEPYIEEFESSWKHAVELMKECQMLSDELREKELVFWETVHGTDDVVDFEIQEQMKKRIRTAGK